MVLPVIIPELDGEISINPLQFTRVDSRLLLAPFGRFTGSDDTSFLKTMILPPNGAETILTREKSLLSLLFAILSVFHHSFFENLTKHMTLMFQYEERGLRKGVSP